MKETTIDQNGAALKKVKRLSHSMNRGGPRAIPCLHEEHRIGATEKGEFMSIGAA